MISMSPEVAQTILSQIQGHLKTGLTQDELAAALVTLADTWRSSLTEPYINGVDGAPSWMEYEHRIWELGETTRAFLKSQRWKGMGAVLEAAAEIIAEPKYGKGRQTFALLIGEFGNGIYGEKLSAMLSDPEIQGYCLKALMRAKIRGHGSKAKVVLDKSSGWIKAAAKKYLDFDAPKN